MRLLKDCFDTNREWAPRMREHDPEFFDRLRHQQSPELLHLIANKILAEELDLAVWKLALTRCPAEIMAG